MKTGRATAGAGDVAGKAADRLPVNGSEPSHLFLSAGPTRSNPSFVTALALDPSLLSDSSKETALEDLLAAIQEASIDAIVTIDARGIMQTFNPAAERISAM